MFDWMVEGACAPAIGRSDVRVVIFCVTVNHTVTAPQVGHYGTVIHALRHFDGNAEQLELTLVTVGVAEAVSHDDFIPGVDALESVKIPIIPEHTLGVLQDALGVLAGQGIDSDSIEHNFASFILNRCDGKGLAPLPCYLRPIRRSPF